MDRYQGISKLLSRVLQDREDEGGEERWGKEETKETGHKEILERGALNSSLRTTRLLDPRSSNRNQRAFPFVLVSQASVAPFSS